jgi:hypothetical protein
VRFRAQIELHGKTATGLRVPEEVVTGLGTSKRPAVRVTIKEHTYRSTVASMHGAFMLPLSAENRELAGVAAGEEVEVKVEVDKEPRDVNLPPDFSKALDDDPEARQFFDGLSYSHKRRYVGPIQQAKAAETRERGIAKALDMLRAGRKQ